MGPFLDSLFCSPEHLSVLTPMPHSCDCRSFRVSLIVRWCESFLFIKVVLTFLDPLRFHINSEISFAVSSKDPAGILIGIASNL